MRNLFSTAALNYSVEAIKLPFRLVGSTVGTALEITGAVTAIVPGVNLASAYLLEGGKELNKQSLKGTNVTLPQDEFADQILDILL